MPALSMTQAMRRLEAHQVDPVYILFGEETYLQHEYLTALTDRILAGAARDFNYDVLYADNDDLAEALAEGMETAHPQMPVFTFPPEEIDDLLAYLDSLD